jgi:hypothetical protein
MFYSALRRKDEIDPLLGGARGGFIIQKKNLHRGTKRIVTLSPSSFLVFFG